MQMRPLPWVAMKLTFSVVANSAAQMRSPLVLPVGVVGAEDHLALAQVLQGLFNGVVLKHGVIPFPAQKPQRVKKSRVIPEGGQGLRLKGLEELFHILSQDIGFQIHRVPHPPVGQGGDRDGVGNGGDGEGLAVPPWPPSG